MSQLEGKLKEVIAYSTVPLDCRFSRVRTEETGLGNFFADLIRTESEADVSFFNSGSLRANMVLPEGAFTRRDLELVFPMPDNVVRLKMKGKLILAAIENGLSGYPKYEGRFPCVSGIKCKFDPEKPAQMRVDVDSIVLEDGSKLEFEKEYIVSTLAFMK